MTDHASAPHRIQTLVDGSLRMQAPAKLNLFLHVTGRRADGYHLLQSVFMRINWCDDITCTPAAEGRITRSDLQGNASGDIPAQDLCVRAALALQAATGSTCGTHISLRKRIPTQAGMGGGSSDAAACLLLLNQLWHLQLTHTQLAAIGLQLGADVPFFLLGQHAWVEGVGEQLTPISLPAADFLVLKPASGVSTPAIFTHPALKRDENRSIMPDFAKTPFEFGHNTLQSVAVQLNPEIAHALGLLAAHGLQGRMTGSGSAVFAKLTNPAAAAAVLASLPQGWVGKIVSNQC